LFFSRHIFLGSLILLFSFWSFAQEKAIHLSFSSSYKNEHVFRGAETWPAPTFFIDPSLVVYEKIFIQGTTFLYSFFNKDSPFYLKAGLSYIDDNKPYFDSSNHKEDYRNQRPSSLELSTTFRYHFGPQNSFYVGLNYFKEVKNHLGQFVELTAGLPLLPYSSLHIKSGRGDKLANQYIYGPSASSGEGFRSILLSFQIPHVSWDGMIEAHVERFWVVQAKNRNAEYIKGKYINDTLSLMFVWKLI
jgi:hypothetical protein